MHLCCVSFHKWCHSFFRVPSPLVNWFLIPLRPLWSRSTWLLTPYSDGSGAVNPNEQLSNAIDKKKKRLNFKEERKRQKVKKESKRVTEMKERSGAGDKSNCSWSCDFSKQGFGFWIQCTNILTISFCLAAADFKYEYVPEYVTGWFAHNCKYYFWTVYGSFILFWIISGILPPTFSFPLRQ